MRISPLPGAVTGSVSSAKCSAWGIPSGLETSRTWRLVRAFMCVSSISYTCVRYENTIENGWETRTYWRRRPPVHPATSKEATQMAGLYYEQFSVGQTFVHEIRRTVTDMDNILFSSLTYNPAAVHIDHEYAKGTEFGKPLMNSIFTLGLIIGLSVQETTLGTTVGNLGMEETRFPRPVFAGDTLRAETKVVAMRESKSRPTQGIVTFEHRGFNQRDEEVVYCRRNGLMMRQPK